MPTEQTPETDEKILDNLERMISALDDVKSDGRYTTYMVEVATTAASWRRLRELARIGIAVSVGAAVSSSRNGQAASGRPATDEALEMRNRVTFLECRADGVDRRLMDLDLLANLLRRVSHMENEFMGAEEFKNLRDKVYSLTSTSSSTMGSGTTSSAPMPDVPVDEPQWYWCESEENWNSADGPYDSREEARGYGSSGSDGKPFWTGRKEKVVYTDVAPAMFDIDHAIEDVNLWLSDNAGVEDPEFDIAPSLKKQLEDQVYGVIIKFFEQHKLYEESWTVDDIQAHNEPVKWREVLDPGKRGWPRDTHGELNKAELLAIARSRCIALRIAYTGDPGAIGRLGDAFLAARAELGDHVRRPNELGADDAP